MAYQSAEDTMLNTSILRYEVKLKVQLPTMYKKKQRFFPAHGSTGVLKQKVHLVQILYVAYVLIHQ